jgi:Holliday junction DNA helicase RuvA
VAVNILSNVKPDDFYLSVSQRRIDFLTKIPGVGKKTAERIILELKDKINLGNMENDIDIAGEPADKSDISFKTAGQDAVAALISLGYSQNEASIAVRKFVGKNKDGQEEYSAQQLIKLALKDLTAK